MRRLGPVLLALLLLGILATPVAASGRINIEEVPVGTYDFTITSDIGCAGFDVEVADISGRIFEVDLGTDRRGTERHATIFRTVTRYTRVGTSDSIERPFDSYGLIVTKADGSANITALGDTLIWDAEPQAMGLGPGIWLIENGSALFQYDTEQTLVRAKRLFGRTFDVCAALS